MKYYIIGGNSETLYTKLNKTKWVFESLDEATKQYRKLVNEIFYKHIYLICDFEFRKVSRFGTVSLESDKDDYLPFFIIGEYHINEDDKVNIYRTDRTCVFRKGFKHEFENNLLALKEFIFCVEKSIPAEFTITYGKAKEVGNYFSNAEITKTIASYKEGDDITRDNGILNRIKVCSPDWHFIGISKARFFNFDLKKDSIKHKEEPVLAVISSPTREEPI